MSGSENDGEETLFTVVQAAGYMRVSENTFRNWVNEGRVGCEPGPQMLFALSKLRKPKLLRQVEVVDHLKARGTGNAGVIARSVAEGVALPSPAPDVRYSMEDVDAIVAFNAGGREPVQPSLGPPSPGGPPAEAVLYKNAVPVEPDEPDEFLLRAGRWAAVMDYIKGHGDPSLLPPTIWDTRDCPEFIPPARRASRSGAGQ